jgi:hypothetical protein
MLPLNAPFMQCSWGAALCHTDFNHAMRCPVLAAQLTLRYNILKGILRRTVHQAGRQRVLALNAVGSCVCL